MTSQRLTGSQSGALSNRLNGWVCAISNESFGRLIPDLKQEEIYESAWNRIAERPADEPAGGPPCRAMPARSAGRPQQVSSVAGLLQTGNRAMEDRRIVRGSRGPGDALTVAIQVTDSWNGIRHLPRHHPVLGGPSPWMMYRRSGAPNGMEIREPDEDGGRAVESLRRTSGQSRRLDNLCIHTISRDNSCLQNTKF